MLRTMIDKSKESYFRCSFNALKLLLTDVDVTKFKYQNQKTKLLSLECGRLLKSRFETFNDQWQKIHANHKTVYIPDESIRREMIALAKTTLMPTYTAFFEKYSAYNFSKKNQAEYLKYTPAIVTEMMGELFSGGNR